MRVERPEAIEALKQYLLSNTAYPFLVAANSSADLKALTRSLPTRVHTISMSDYCTDDGLPDEDAVFNVLLNANNPILLKGAGEMEEACRTDDVYANPALMNAALKYIASERYGCHIEVFMGYGERLGSLGQWYVQLLAESLGKKHNRNGEIVYYGRTPVPAVGTTDMHAQTQLHQDGIRNKVVQFLQIKNMPGDIVLGMPFEEPAFKKYNGLNMSDALAMALDSNAEALNSDRRFNARYVLPEMNAYHLGELFYFLMLSVAYEGELANVDAFDQPGVEAYKKIMKAKFAERSN